MTLAWMDGCNRASRANPCWATCCKQGLKLLKVLLQSKACCYSGLEVEAVAGSHAEPTPGLRAAILDARHPIAS